MKFFSFIFMILPVMAYSQENNAIIIQKIDLNIKGINYQSEIIAPDYDTSSKVQPDNLVLKIHNNNNRIIEFTLKDIENDCNSQSIELGKYQITDSSIIFYSWWGSAGGCCARPGVMKKEYVVNKNNSLELKTSIVVETTFNTKVVELNDYFFKNIAPKIETEENAIFVTGHKAADLIKQVKSKLANEISISTKNWNSYLINPDYCISIPQYQ